MIFKNSDFPALSPATLTGPLLASISLFLPIHFSNNPNPKMGSNTPFYTTRYFSSPVAPIFLRLGISVNTKLREQSAQQENENIQPFSQSSRQLLMT